MKFIRVEHEDRIIHSGGLNQLGIKVSTSVRNDLT